MKLEVKEIEVDSFEHKKEKGDTREREDRNPSNLGFFFRN